MYNVFVEEETSNSFDYWVLEIRFKFNMSEIGLVTTLQN